MILRNNWFLLGPLLLAGCASTPPPGIDHPANPAASAANSNPLPQTLALGEGIGTKPVNEVDDSHAGHDMDTHAGHSMEAMEEGSGETSADSVHTGHNHAEMKSNDAQNLYWCPMDPEIVQEGPGKCPICGMALKPKPAEEPVEAPKGESKHDH